MDEFRSLLRSRLTERGAQARLSEISGIPSPVIGRWRDGIGRPTDTNLKRLAPALGVPYEELARMCGYGLGASDANPALDPDIAEMVAIFFQVPASQRSIVKAMVRAAANTAEVSTVNHPGGRLNRRKTGRAPDIQSHQRGVAGMLVAFCSPFLRRPASAPFAATA